MAPFSGWIVQSLNSPFFPPPYRVWTRAGERRVQDNLHAHAQNAAIFSPKSGEKPYLEVLSRFDLWLDFLYNNTQKTCQLIPNQWNFTSATLNDIRSVFTQCNIKDNERRICQGLLTIEKADSDLKVHALHYANELLVRVRLSFQKLLQTRSTCRNNTRKCLGKE